MLRTRLANSQLGTPLHLKPASRPLRLFRASSSPTATSSEIAEAKKQRIVQLSGTKNGTDKSAEEKQQIVAVAEELAQLNRVDQLDMTGTRWKLVFTESMASSSGKIGPFVCRTEQEFPENQRNQYINWCYLGPLAISLLADYTQAKPDRIDVSFKYLQVQGEGALLRWIKWQKELTNSGTWDSMYVDEDFRVFKANKKNLFVLKKIP